MSPRAAWRLESIGFTQVYDYVAGKADWGSAGLPLEGTRGSETRVGAHLRHDVPTSRPGSDAGAPSPPGSCANDPARAHRSRAGARSRRLQRRQQGRTETITINLRSRIDDQRRTRSAAANRPARRRPAALAVQHPLQPATADPARLADLKRLRARGQLGPHAHPQRPPTREADRVRDLAADARRRLTRRLGRARARRPARRQPLGRLPARRAAGSPTTRPAASAHPSTVAATLAWS